MNKNDGKKMIREMREMIRARNKSVRELEPYQAGMYFLVNEDFERSAASFQLAIKQNPHFAFSHYYLGRSLRRLGKYQEALAAFAKAIKLNSLHAPSYAYRLNRPANTG